MTISLSQLLPAQALTGAETILVAQLSSTSTLTASTISAQASDNSYNHTGDGFVTAGFLVGDRIRVVGFTGNTINNIYSAAVTAVTASKLTIGGTDGDVIVDDAAGESVTITKWVSRRSGFASLASGSSLSYTINTDSVADSDPGNGLLQFNNASQSAATFLYIDNQNIEAVLLTTYFASLAQTGFIHIVQTNAPAIWRLYKVTSVVAGAGYYKIGVISQAGQGAFVDDVPVRVFFDVDANGQLASSIADFTEAAQDAVGAAITAGVADGVTLTYDDANNRINSTNTDKGTVARTAHEAAVDPHPQYTTAAEASAGAPVQSVGGKQGTVPFQTATETPATATADNAGTNVQTQIAATRGRWGQHALHNAYPTFLAAANAGFGGSFVGGTGIAAISDGPDSAYAQWFTTYESIGSDFTAANFGLQRAIPRTVVGAGGPATTVLPCYARNRTLGTFGAWTLITAIDPTRVLKAGDTMTGQLTVLSIRHSTVGTATSVAFGNTNNTGIYGDATSVRIAASGAESLTVSNGNVGVSQGTAGVAGVEIGQGRTADGPSYLDMIGDTTYTDYGTRLIRNGGVTGETNLQHRGTGALRLTNQDGGDVILSTTAGDNQRSTAAGYTLFGFASNTFSTKVQVAGAVATPITNNILSGLTSSFATDAFTVDGDKLISNYGLSWKSFSDLSTSGPAAALSGFGGVRMYTGATERMRINVAGAVGIGTSNNPIYGNLNVRQDGGGGPSIILTNREVNGSVHRFGAIYFAPYRDVTDLSLSAGIWAEGPAAVGNTADLCFGTVTNGSNSSGDIPTRLRINSVGAASFTGDVTTRDVIATRGDGTGVIFFGPPAQAKYLYWDNSSYVLYNANLNINGGLAWHSLNDGAGSGLDADLLDGLNSTSFTRAAVNTNWADLGVVNNVVGQLAWKNYANNHTIFDASASTTPTGAACSNTNSAAPWTSTYPTLMGYNGITTYGVRVDTARNAEVLNGLSTQDASAAPAVNQIMRSDANRFLYTSYINSSNPNNEVLGPQINQVVVTNGSDSFLRKANIVELAKAVSAMMEPIGTIFITTTATNPGNYKNGVWAAFGTGRTLVGIDTGNANFNSVEETGGSSLTSLSTANMPAHSHFVALSAEVNNSAVTNANTVATRDDAGGDQDYDLSGQVGEANVGNSSTVGSGSSFSNLQPYIVVYFWKRTA